MPSILPLLVLGLLTAQEPVKKGPQGREIFKRPGTKTEQPAIKDAEASQESSEDSADGSSANEPSEERVLETETEIEKTEAEHRRRQAKIERVRDLAKESGNTEAARKADELLKKNRELHGRKLEKVREKHGDKAFQKAHKKMNEKLAKSGKGKSSSLVAVCHAPPGNAAKRHVIHVSEAAVNAHLKHGDTLGDCGEETTPRKQGGSAPDVQKKGSRKVDTERMKGGKTKPLGEGGFKRPGQGGGRTEAPDGSEPQTDTEKKSGGKVGTERVKGKRLPKKESGGFKRPGSGGSQEQPSGSEPTTDTNKKSGGNVKKGGRLKGGKTVEDPR